MSELRYPPRALLGDYTRSGLGIVLTLPPAIAVPVGSPAQYVLALLVALFGTFGARTLLRQSSKVALGPEDITVSALRRTRLEWSRLRSVKLSYYSTRGDRGEGWMQLTLKGSGGPGGGTIRVDSSLDGFVEVARAAADAARLARIALSETTRVNFVSLGIAVDDAEPEAAQGQPGMNPLLTVRDLRVQFKIQDHVVRAVDGVSFSVPPGRTVAIVGESGSGKSVMSQAIMGILPTSARIASGEIVFDDPRGGGPVDIAALDPDGGTMRSIRGGRISIIFQEPMTSLSPLHTIGDQIGEALHLHRDVTKAEGESMVEEMLKRVGFPHPKRALSTYPFELSGGLRQRAMIAMALVCRPALLIADEPTTALDVTIQAQILKLLSDLQQELGMAILIITHDLGVVANMAEDVVVMYRGRVMESGTQDDIFRAPGHDYLKALLRAVPRFGMKPGERLTPLREIRSETGHLIAEREPWPADADAAGPLLSVQGVTKRFSIRKSGWRKTGHAQAILAVDDVGFTVERGECLGLVGESGCGKTTLSKILMRALRPDQGAVAFNDRGTVRDVLALEGDDLTRFRQRMQFIFQDPYGSLNPRMTIFDIIGEPLVIHEIGDHAYRLEMVQELMKLVGLDPRFLNRYPHSFSGGQRQRIGIARALALRPDLIICDEPVSALDVSIQAQILNLLKDLKAKLGLTYLFISHNLAVVDYIADRIAVMCAGRLVEVAPTRELFDRPIHPYTRALLAAVPEPNPDRKLDLTALMEGRASNPADWPWPFKIEPGAQLDLIDVGDMHFVRADPAADIPSIMHATEMVA